MLPLPFFRVLVDVDDISLVAHPIKAPAKAITSPWQPIAVHQDGFDSIPSRAIAQFFEQLLLVSDSWAADWIVRKIRVFGACRPIFEIRGQNL